MSKIHISFLILIYLISNSNTKDNSFTTIKLKDLVETPFILHYGDYIIFEYENKGQRLFNSSINFIFKEELFKPTVCLYDSLDKINKNGSKFYDCLYKTDTSSNIQISYTSSFYRDNCTYYLAIYNSPSYYKNSIWVVNSLKYINLDNDLEIIYKSNVLFHFIIEKKYSTYLHYQTKFVNLLHTFYNISIINEKGDILLNDSLNSASGYIEIKPNMKYYVDILTSDYASYNSRIISLNFEKYKNNILIKDENEINKTVLSSQNYTFFKDISNIEINETIILNAFYKYEINLKYEFYAKFYNSTDFESLVDSFPTDKKDFDYKLEMKGYGSNYTTEIKKINETNRGILIGFFEDGDCMYPNYINKIHLRLFKPQQKSDEDDGKINSDDYPDKKASQKNTSLHIGWIIFIVMISLIIVVIIIWALVMYKNKKRKIQTDKEISNNYYNYNNNNVNQVPNNIGNYNSSSGNNDNDNYYNKISKDDENIYDNLAACPPIN